MALFVFQLIRKSVRRSLPEIGVRGFIRSCKKLFDVISKNEGPTEIWTRIAGFKVQSANHYTMGPLLFIEDQLMKKFRKTHFLFVSISFQRCRHNIKYINSTYFLKILCICRYLSVVRLSYEEAASKFVYEFW